MTVFGIVSTRLAGNDGVSLEMRKIVTVLNKLGHHDIVYCAGELDDELPGMVVPKMHFTDAEISEISAQSFGKTHCDEALYAKIWEITDQLYASLVDFIEKYKVNVIVSQNSNAIPMNIPLGVAIALLSLRTRIPLICHNHDFYWERDRFLVNGIDDLLEFAFPPCGSNIQHLTISSIAQSTLFKRRGITSFNTPNVFDFANPPTEPNATSNSALRAKLGISDDKWIVLQPTRVVRRKGIEKSIELVSKLGDKAVLVVTGDPYNTDEGGRYGLELIDLAKHYGIEVIWLYSSISEGGGLSSTGQSISLWDIYPIADIVSYPSTIEGFGNALVEAVYHKKPLLVHRYPVYLSDIASKGVKAIEIDHQITQHTIEQVREVLSNTELRDRRATHNYKVGMECFSFEALQNIIDKCIH